MNGNVKEEDFNRMEFGEECAIPCIEESDGTHFISSIKNGFRSGHCNFPMGISYEVIPKEKRTTKPTHNPAFVLHEVRIGDQILMLTRYEETKLYVRKYIVYNIQNNALLIIGLHDEFLYRDDN